MQRIQSVFVAMLLVALIGTHRDAEAQGTRTRVVDLGLPSGLQDSFFGHLKRGRALVAADFDLDGRVDFYLGNPGDESFVVRNVPGPGGRPRFQPVQTLLTDELAWGAVAFDYDNDGDYDLFVTVGGNEGIGFDHLFRNRWIEDGKLSFEDVTDAAGVAGPVPPGGTGPIEVAGANAVVADYDRDGWDDIFVNVNKISDYPTAIWGRNILWHNQGDGTFEDVTDAAGLGVSLAPTRHSTFFDFDNDGDFDLYENNNGAPNILWRNRLVEDGVASFEDVTALLSPPGEDLSYPHQSFGSAAADFNNDGWEDLLVVMRSTRSGPESGSPYPEGHALFINQQGTGFVNVAATAGLNSPFTEVNGVMGCQVGDVSGDGVPDVYIGNGGPSAGTVDTYFVADSGIGEDPHFTDQTALIDFPAAQGPGPSNPPYPYRTHGTSFVDVDNDGSLEIAVSNGGRAESPDDVQEPNRLFKFVNPTPPSWLEVRPVGGGGSVSQDAVGTRFAVTVSKGGGTPWTVYGTLFAGSCFSAQNGFQVHFGLGNADTVQQLRITWPDGMIETRTIGLTINSSIVVERQHMEGVVRTHRANDAHPSQRRRSAQASLKVLRIFGPAPDFACG